MVEQNQLRRMSESGYLRRVVDDQLDRLLDGLPAVCIEGPRAVGKTWTALRRAGTVYDLDDPETLTLVEAAPTRLLHGDAPIFIDEWQRYPPSWDLVRRAVDSGTGPGGFLLAGSTSPQAPPAHSGAGRIVTLRMRPMSSFERSAATPNAATPSVSLSELLKGDRLPVDGDTDATLEHYTREIVSGGFPGLRSLDPSILPDALDGYLDRSVDHDLVLMGRRARRPGVLRRWLTAYAAATSTTSTYETIRDAATGGQSGKPAKTTTTAYRDLLEAMWLVDPLPAWQPLGNPLSRLKRGPKHHLADPALAARLIGATTEGLINGRIATPRGFGAGPLLGALFESLVTLDVRVYAQTVGARVGHMRTWNDDREIDLIVEKDGRALALEVKLTATPRIDDTAHLRWLAQRLGSDLADAVIVTTGRHAYRDKNGIAVVPAALLGP